MGLNLGVGGCFLVDVLQIPPFHAWVFAVLHITCWYLQAVYWDADVQQAIYIAANAPQIPTPNQNPKSLILNPKSEVLNPKPYVAASATCFRCFGMVSGRSEAQDARHHATSKPRIPKPTQGFLTTFGLRV